MSNNYMFKYILIGDSNTGKSSIMKRYINNSFNYSDQLTIGIDYYIKTVSCYDKNIKLFICDTTGQERFRSITRSYYKNILGAIIVYDITNKKSFLSVINWINDIKENTENVVLFLVGNKCDLEKRQVSYNEGLELSKEFNMFFIETSIKNDIEQIDTNYIFNILTENVYNKIISNQLLCDVILEDKIKIDIITEKKNKCC